MPTNIRKKKQPEDYELLAENRGFRWLGPEVRTTKTLTTWECSKGHQWQAIYNNIQQGRDCPDCARRKTDVDYHLLAQKRNFQWLGPFVTNYILPTNWKCQFGHEWLANYREILRGDTCPTCSKTGKQANELKNGGIWEEDKIADGIQIDKLPPDAEIASNVVLFDWWGKNSINFLKPLFASTKTFIRLSTGFFSIQGYNLLKSHLENKQIDILVGYDDRSRDELKMTLIEEIMDDLEKWKGRRREAVLHLVDKLKKRELRIVDARLRKKDHSKIYIFDGEYVASGSTNLTKNGLLNNQEGDLAISKAEQTERVEWWCRQYEMYWTAPGTVNVSQMLLERLKAWLGLYKPWDVYLKTIQALVPENKPIHPRENYRVPAEFQMVVVDRAIRQLDEWRGAMIVASTGLGKTIIATHIAYLLLQIEQSILNVMVVAPKPVKDEWDKRMRSAGVSASIHTRNLLDMPINQEQNQNFLDKLLEVLLEVDDKWLIIIDESQYFKNRERGPGGERLSFARLIEVINEKKCLVLLLTATPYATEPDNINHQLLLLPHTNPNENPHQRAIPGLEPDKLYLRSWKIKRVEDLVNLPIGTVINTPYVAQNFAIQSEDGDYLMFGDQKKYIPKILISKVKVPVILEASMTKALDGGYFKHDVRRWKSRGNIWMRSTSDVENKASVAWASSPWALMDVIEKTITEKGYDCQFTHSIEDRIEVLTPLLIALREMKYNDDEKFATLLVLIRELRKDGHKILIFSERLITAVYIEKGLQAAIPQLRIANTVMQDGNEFIQKDFQDVYPLMVGFAPRSNPKENGLVPEDKYDILITTDAYSQGVNLQDASVVIHYDIAWTPDTIIQRAGRILRFWPEPRMVHFYVFAGTYQQDSSHRKQSLKLESRLKKLITRTKEAEKFSEIPSIPDGTQRFETLRGLSSLVIETLGYIGARNLEDERLEVSTFLTHLTQLKNNASYAKTIPDDIASALTTTKVRAPKLYVLVKYQKKYHCIFYDITDEKIERMDEDQLLNKIKCTEETVTAFIDENEIERHQQNCINLWCKKKNLNEEECEEVAHVCTLYLSPDEKRLDTFLSEK